MLDSPDPIAETEVPETDDPETDDSEMDVDETDDTSPPHPPETVGVLC